jgi:hypothetical protein
LIVASDPLTLTSVGLSDPEGFEINSIEAARMWEAIAVMAARILRHPNTTTVAPNLARANLTLTAAQDTLFDEPDAHSLTPRRDDPF